jgi:hypothetical protein
VSGTPTEVGCSDGFDNDYDQAIDCSDPDCDGKQCYGTGRQFPTTRELLPSQPGSQAYKLAFAGVVGATGGTIVKAVLVMPWLSNDPNRYTLDLRTLQDPSQPACVGAITYTMNGYVYRCDVTAAVLNWFASAVPDAERGFVLTGTPGLLGTTNLGIDIDRRAACIQKHCTPQ